MILKIALVLLYLVMGLWLFVAAVSSMGGLSEIPGYEKKSIAVISAVLVMIFWPVFILHGVFKRRR